MRTTDAAVKGIIEVDSGVDLTPFITTANELVTEATDGAGLSDTRLELIERWLAAHFYAVFVPRPTAERAGSVGQTLQSKVDLNLAVTHYGQQAMVLDTGGGLAKLNKRAMNGKRTAAVHWLGTEST